MRTVKEKLIEEKIYSAIGTASFTLEPEIKKLLQNALKTEKNPYGKKVLEIIIDNIHIAEMKRLPLCQDTGMVEVFFEIGTGAIIEFNQFNSLQELVDSAVRRAYKDFYLRKSIVTVPDRKNTFDNTPAVLWCEIVPGDRINFSILIKGFGSENTTTLKMFKPTVDMDAVKKFVVGCVKKAGPNPCPPVFVGIGMGGTADKALYLSKKALLETGRQQRGKLEEIEKQLISEINALMIGPGGFGGDNTCLDVRIKNFPTHIAGFPVAVSISCWAHRMHRVEI